MKKIETIFACELRDLPYGVRFSLSLSNKRFIYKRYEATLPTTGDLPVYMLICGEKYVTTLPQNTIVYFKK